MFLKINKSELVEVPVTVAQATSTQINFPDLPQLREKLIDSLETFYSVDAAITITNSAVATAAQALNAYLVLYISDPDNPGSMGEFIKEFPLNALHRVQSAVGVPFVREIPQFAGLRIQWPKCFIRLPAGLGNVATVTFLFNVYYHNPGVGSGVRR